MLQSGRKEKECLITFLMPLLKKSWAQLPEFENDESRCSYHLYPLRIKNITEAQRDAIIDVISCEQVAVNVHFIPLPLLTVFKEKNFDIADFPATYDNYSREISLPIYPQLDNNLCEHIVRVVTKAVIETV